MLIILPALFDKRIKTTLLLAGTSFFIHTSSLFIFFTYRTLISIKLWMIVIIIPIVCLLIYFNQDVLSDYISHLSLNIDNADRFNSFSQISDKYSPNLTVVRQLLIPVLSIFAAWLCLLISENALVISREEKAHQRRWIVFYFSIFLLYMSLINFRELSHRFFLMVHGMMIGWFVALFLKRLPYSLFLTASCFILAWNFLGMARQDWSSMAMPGVSYPLIGIFPGYFFLYYFF
jgi:hypothetical protein